MTHPSVPFMGFKFLSVRRVNVRPVHVLWRKWFQEKLRKRISITVTWDSSSASLCNGEGEK